MTHIRFPVSVIVQRTPLVNRWVSERWEPIAVETANAVTAALAATHTPENCREGRWRFRGHAIELHRSEAEGYFLNATSPEPKVFVMWRLVDEGAVPPVRPEVVTVSYNEAARLMDGGEHVDAVPMPAEILAWMSPFVALHYKPEPKRKVRRNDPFAERDATGRDRRQR